MDIFLDTADVASIEKWNETGLIDGVTTNPSHLSKAGNDPKQVILDICSLLPEGNISVEVTESEPEAVYRQAKEIAALSENIYVKIPCHKDYFSVINRLVNEGVQLNITLVFTLIQATLMAKLGVGYISPFVGRWDDIDVDGMQLIRQMRNMINQYHSESEILAASLRHVRHVHQAIEAGADVITVPASLFEKIITHPLTDQGIEKFNADWQRLNITKFP